jgi:hypothetical protein
LRGPFFERVSDTGLAFTLSSIFDERRPGAFESFGREESGDAQEKDGEKWVAA